MDMMANVTESMMNLTTTTTSSVYRTMNTTNYYYGEYLRNNSPGVRRMNLYLTEINLIKCSIFIAIAFIGLCLNFYFVGCIAFLKSLRQWRYMLVAWQALCDITGVCIIGGILQSAIFIRNNQTLN
ncbi:uncharacterized protein LOC142357356, partial [Convolutriloba macropyga]|uniref:uncharacterized protein LOC142357356 n=1 Tax=Convolutriloba macropyga TaxID=536237 RepID=UPI003F5229E3